MMSQGKGSRLLVCQDAWADQGDESELHFVADVVLKITVFVFHFRCWFVVVSLFGLRTMVRVTDGPF